MNKELLNRVFSGYQLTDRLDTDPVDSFTFFTTTPYAMAFCQVWPIRPENAMDLDRDGLIQGIHNSLAPNQALIEVDCGATENGNEYIYSIVKTMLEPNGVQYVVLLHYWASSAEVLNFQGFFEERGTTGIRDATVFSAFGPDISFDEKRRLWTFDPYDDSFVHPTLMNQSELADYDRYFPEHPLSLARIFVKRIIE